MFSIVATPFHIPTSNTRGFQLFHSLDNTCYFLFLFFLNNSDPNGYDVVSHWLWFAIFLMIGDAENLFMWFLAICISVFWRNVCLSPLPSVELDCLFCFWVAGALYIVQVSISYQIFNIWFANISAVLWVAFSLC